MTLQFFGDLQCRESRQVMLGAIPFLIRHWVREGKLRIRYRSTETDTKSAGGYDEFELQQSAALAAGKQEKFWNFVDAFYREQGPEFTGYVDEAFLDRIAQTAGLDVKRWEAEWTPADWVKPLRADRELAISKRVISTPSFLVGPTGEAGHPLRHFSLEDSSVFDEAVKETLRKIETAGPGST